MRWASLISAATIIVIANALALLHVARNRAGDSNAEITLTNRELQYFGHAIGDDDSGTTLALRWMDSNSASWPAQDEAPPKWLDQKTLQALGFDCSVNPENPSAATFYRRQRPRAAFVAMEYDGPASRAFDEALERSAAQQQALGQPEYSATWGPLRGPLVAIDSDLNADKLRTRHPDHRTVLIVPAVVAIGLIPFPHASMKRDAKHPVRISGHIEQLASAIHVPRPYSDEFRRLQTARREAGVKDVVFRVHLRYGSQHEPWVTGVDFPQDH